MDALASVLVSLVAGSAWAPAALSQRLVAAQERAFLPVGVLAPWAGGIEVGFHRRAALPMAYLHARRGRRLPRLSLYAPYYLRGRELVAIESMRLDVSEYLFHSLLVGYLDEEVRGGGPLGVRLRERAEALMVEVPPAHRVEAYVDAVASFGSHALSVANEVAGKAARGPEARERLCRQAAQGAPLFALWRRMLAGEPYPGTYEVPRNLAAGEEGGVRLTISTPGAEDKRLVLEEVLGAGWRGDPEADFAAVLCRP